MPSALRRPSMRLALWTLIVVAALSSLTLGSSAFNYARAERTIQVSIADDSLAYLAMAENGLSPHRCFVDETDGKLSITFDTPSSGCGSGAGTGINPGDGTTSGRYARYAFHDLLIITNKARSPLILWVNASTGQPSESNIDVALETSAGQMVDAAYSNAEVVTDLAVGSQVYMGLRVKSGMIASGTLSTTLSVEARR